MGGSSPRPQPAQIAPKETDPEAQRAQAEALRRRQRAASYNTTVLRQMAFTQDQQTTKRLETLGS